tara:strand:- start:267 stop:569 length:303 start_codon:yes stop_codon:yes gene_type:complete
MMKYKFVEGKNTGEHAIQIDEGKYADVVYVYGKVGIDERTNDCRLYFDYNILDNSEVVEDDDDFKEVIGDILVDLLENHLEEGDIDGDSRNDHSEKSDSQ